MIEFLTGGPFAGSYVIMACIGILFVYLGIAKKWEPLLFVPIGFTILIVNLSPGMMAASLDVTAPVGGVVTYIHEIPDGGTVRIEEGATLFVIDDKEIKAPSYGILKSENIKIKVGDSVTAAKVLARLESVSPFIEGVRLEGFIARLFHYGIQWEIIPLLIFVGLGALTDFGPLIADPKKLILGAAAQFGVFIAAFVALFLGFDLAQAACIGIIGGADGPTTVYLTNKLAPLLLVATVPAAYTYMAMVPLIQPFVIRLITTKKERAIYMKPQLREVSQLEKILFPFLMCISIGLLLPQAGPLIGCFMIGNLFQVAGVKRLSKTAGDALMDILIICLGFSIGGIMVADAFLRVDTMIIFGLGIVAFAFSTAGGVLMAKFMNLFLKEKINPLIGAAGVSAVPMSARVVQRMGQEANPDNYLLMHAMGPNAAGVIGTIVVASFFLMYLL